MTALTETNKTHRYLECIVDFSEYLSKHFE